MQFTVMTVSFMLSIIIGSLLLTVSEAKPDLIEVINNIPTRYGKETEIVDFENNGNEEVIDVITLPNGQQTTQVREYSAQQVYNTWGRTYNGGYNNYGYNTGYNNYGYNNGGYNNYNRGYYNNNYGYNNGGYNNYNRGYYNNYYGKK